MYTVDNQDVVIEVSDAPRPDVGAPLPLILSDEHHLFLAYLVSEPDPDWDGSCVNVVSPNSNDEAVALIRFKGPYARMFGPPNDDTIQGHPLSNRGLEPYAVFEIQGSSWIRGLEAMASGRFLVPLRHFIFAFHDSTFECVAQGFEVEIFRGSLRNVLDRMVESLTESWPG